MYGKGKSLIFKQCIYTYEILKRNNWEIEIHSNLIKDNK